MAVAGIPPVHAPALAAPTCPGRANRCSPPPADPGASSESCLERIPPGFPTVGASLTLFLTDGRLLGLCSASAVSSFLLVLRLGFVNLEGYIAFSLFPHLSAIPCDRVAHSVSRRDR